MQNPLKKLILWATGASATYPASPVSPWAGTTTQVMPAYGAFAPGAANAPTAQEMNAILNARDTAIQQLQAWTGQIDSLNWLAGVALPANTNSTVLAWDGQMGRWLQGNEVGAIYQTFDGRTWTQLGSALPSTRAVNNIAVRPSDGVVVTIELNGFPGTFGNCAVLNPSAGTWTEYSGPNITFNAAMNGCTLLTYFSGRWVFLFGTNGSGDSTGSHAVGIQAFSAADGHTWVASGSTLPTGTVAGGSVGWEYLHNFQSNSAQSASILLVFPNDVGTVATKYLTTTDGQTWTQQNMPALGATERVVGAGYDAANGIFYFCSSTGSAARLWSSTTGIAGSWTPTTATDFQIFSFAVSGGELVACAQLRGSWTVITSINGGASWSRDLFPPQSAPVYVTAGDVNFGAAGSWIASGSNDATNWVSVAAGQMPAIAY